MILWKVWTMLERSLCIATIDKMAAEILAIWQSGNLAILIWPSGIVVINRYQNVMLRQCSQLPTEGSSNWWQSIRTTCSVIEFLLPDMIRSGVLHILSIISYFNVSSDIIWWCNHSVDSHFYMRHSVFPFCCILFSSMFHSNLNGPKQSASFEQIISFESFIKILNRCHSHYLTGLFQRFDQDSRSFNGIIKGRRGPDCLKVGKYAPCLLFL